MSPPPPPPPPKPPAPPPPPAPPASPPALVCVPTARRTVRRVQRRRRLRRAGACACSEGLRQRATITSRRTGRPAAAARPPRRRCVHRLGGITPTVERPSTAPPPRESRRCRAAASPECKRTSPRSANIWRRRCRRARPAARCPLRTLQVQRQAAGLPFPMPEADVRRARRPPGRSRAHRGQPSLEAGSRCGRRRMLVEGNPAVLRRLQIRGGAGCCARRARRWVGGAGGGWPTSQGFVMEALHEAVYGTIANLLSRPSPERRLLSRRSLKLATMASVCAVHRLRRLPGAPRLPGGDRRGDLDLDLYRIRLRLLRARRAGAPVAQGGGGAVRRRKGQRRRSAAYATRSWRPSLWGGADDGGACIPLLFCRILVFRTMGVCRRVHGRPARRRRYAARARPRRL